MHRSYGPRSYLYAEMVFGNTFIVSQLMTSTSQVPIHAMRTPRPITLPEITARTGSDRGRSPSLQSRARPTGPGARARSTCRPTSASSAEDVAFWRRPPDPSYAAVLNDFVASSPAPNGGTTRRFAPVLAEFRRRFSETGTEEGMVMATVLAYAMDQAYTQQAANDLDGVSPQRRGEPADYPRRHGAPSAQRPRLATAGILTPRCRRGLFTVQNLAARRGGRRAACRSR